jgi:hypothetical protein
MQIGYKHNELWNGGRLSDALMKDLKRLTYGEKDSFFIDELKGLRKKKIAFLKEKLVGRRVKFHTNNFQFIKDVLNVYGFQDKFPPFKFDYVFTCKRDWVEDDEIGTDYKVNKDFPITVMPLIKRVFSEDDPYGEEEWEDTSEGIDLKKLNPLRKLKDMRNIKMFEPFKKVINSNDPYGEEIDEEKFKKIFPIEKIYIKIDDINKVVYLYLKLEKNDYVLFGEMREGEFQLPRKDKVHSDGSDLLGQLYSEEKKEDCEDWYNYFIAALVRKDSTFGLTLDYFKWVLKIKC